MRWLIVVGLVAMALADDLDALTITDWLGRRQPVNRKSLELTTSGGGGGVTAPVTPSVQERVTAAQDVMSSRMAPGSRGAVPGGTTAREILAGLGTGTSAIQKIAQMLPSGVSPTIDPAIRAAAAEELSPRSGGSLVTEPLTSQQPFQIPSDVLTGKGGGGTTTPTTPPEETGGGAGGPGEAGGVEGGSSAGGASDLLGATGTALPLIAGAIGVAQDAMSNRQNSIKAIDAAITTTGAVLDALGVTYGLGSLAASLSKEDLDRMNADFQQGNYLRGIALDTFMNPVTLVADIVQLFGGPDFTKNFLRGNKGTRYTRTRENAVNQTNLAMSELGAAYKGITDLPSALSALQQRFGGGHVWSQLRLPENVATSLGLPKSETGAYYWQQMSPQQFGGLMVYFNQNPDAIAGSVTASGDVPYLPQGAAQQVSDATANATRQLLSAISRNIVPPSAPTEPTPTPSMPAVPTPPLTTRGPSGALGFASQLLNP